MSRLQLTDDTFHQHVEKYFTDPDFANEHPISTWDVSQVTNMDGAFARKADFNESLEEWDVSNVISMRGMFLLASSFNQPLERWNVGKVEDMSMMFYYASSFNQHLEQWNVSNVKDMSLMFSNTHSFNMPLNGWDVSEVTDIKRMFMVAVSFNQPLDRWNVSKVVSMNNLFAGAVKFNHPIENWDVGNVTSMEFIFSQASEFNQPLNAWNVSRVKSTYFMFNDANKFNQPLDRWNVGQVNDMRGMFSHAKHFNQPLNSWDVSNVRYFNHMFTDAHVFEQNQVRSIMNWNVSEEADTQDMLSAETLRWLIVHKWSRRWRSRPEGAGQTPRLPISAVTIHPDTDTGMDLISGEETTVNAYLREDPGNVVFYFNQRVVLLSHKDQLEEFYMNPSYIGNSVKFACKAVETSIIPRRDNIEPRPAYISLRSLGCMVDGLVTVEEMVSVVETQETRCVNISSTPSREVPSTASYQMLGPTPNAVGASHCQEGQGAKVYSLEDIPMQMGGKRRRKTRKRRRANRRTHKRRRSMSRR